MHTRAGTVALPEDLINPEEVVAAYYDIEPDPTNPNQRVVFGTSGHRGSSLDHAFNEAHIAATTLAIVEYRASQGIDGPLFIGRDTHALSEPAWRTAIEVLSAAGVTIKVDLPGRYTPTPSVSVAILGANGAPENLRHDGSGLADGIVVTPSHNPPRDGGFKYNPPHGGPADTDATSWIAARANELLENGWKDIPRATGDVYDMPGVEQFDYMTNYVDQLDTVIDMDAIREAGVRIGADPLGGAAVDYWAAIGEHYGLNLTVVNPKVDPAWPFMTLDWDGKIRMDCSSPYAMASLRGLMTPDEDGNTPFDVATGNDADSDRHGIVTADGLMNPNHYLAVAIDYLFSHRPHWPADAAVGKTLVSSALIDRVVAAMGRQLIEVPVGFKYFVPGLVTGSVGFGGEESAGASFLRKNPNHYLAVAIDYLFNHRPNWPADAAVGKTLVSSALIDRVVAAMGRELIEVPVGFKYFVPGLVTGTVGFGGEESAGASFLRKDGTVWSTDKDGIILCLLASEIIAVTGKTPSQLHAELVEKHGASAYARIDAAANREEKAKLAALSADDVTATELAGDPIVAKLVRAPGNDAAIGGLKVVTEHAWFAARPSGTEDVYKIYAESFKGAEHLAEVQEAAKKVVSDALGL